MDTNVESIKNRAITIPSIGDPFLLHLWFTLSLPNFINEIDHVYLAVDGQDKTSGPLQDAFAKAKHHIIKTYSALPYVTAQIVERGGIMGTIEDAYHMVKHPLFGMIQEDAFVYKQGEIDRMFRLIESEQYDVVGTPMYCYSGALHPILDATINYRNERYLNEIGYAFWQNFFFSRTATIRETDLNFDVVDWKKDQYVPYLQRSMPEAFNLDGMASISFQLRALRKRFYYVPQMCSMIDRHFEIYDVCFWQHVNSLSSIFTYMVSGVEKRMLGDSERIEMERRVAWWEFALDRYPTEMREQIEDFYWTYRGAVDAITGLYDLQRGNIDKRKEIIGRLFYEK
jgi:hypothetical protein